MSNWNLPIFNIKKTLEKEETTIEDGYYSTREVTDMCEMTAQKTSAMLTQLYYEGKVERRERKVKRYGNDSVHIRVYRSRELESIEELVKRKVFEAEDYLFSVQVFLRSHSYRHIDSCLYNYYVANEQSTMHT